MSFQTIVNSCASPCAIISVEITSDSSRGEMKVICGNVAFAEVVGPSYRNGMHCEELEFGGANFDDLCVRSAIMGQRVHSYVHREKQDEWIDLTLFPLVRVGDQLGHCLLFTETSDAPDPERMASVSMDTAAAALKASVALMSADDLKSSVKQVLDDVLERSGGFSARVTLVDTQLREAELFCEAFVKGFFADDAMAEVTTPYEVVESWREILGNENMVVIESDSDFGKIEPYNPEWVASLRMFGVTSFIMTALRQGPSIIGYLQLSNFDVLRIDEVKELMEIITFLLGAQIANNLLVAELERRSLFDDLTNLQNRHAMSQRVAATLSQRDGGPFGIINVDVNGLKVVNDTDGHDAGDRLLVNVANVLRRVFRKEDLFRAGGDEFIVFVSGIERDVFDRKVEQLRREVESDDKVSFAIGAHWSDGSDDFRTAFKQADELMYADKEAFYKAHGRPDRR